MRESNNPFILIVTTLVTSIVAAAGLGATYAVTGPKIQAQIKATEQASLKAALPGAKSFTRVQDPAVLKKATEAAGNVRFDPSLGDGVFVAEGIGTAVKLGSRGYGGYIVMVVGLDRSGKVTGVSVVSANETPGLGSKVVGSAEFLGQFKKWSADSIEQDAKKLDAVSGATKSSKGVERGVESAARIYNAIASEIGGGEAK